MWLTCERVLERNQELSEWRINGPKSSRGDKDIFPGKLDVIVVKVRESLEKGYTNRRRYQAWMPEKEAQSRPLPPPLPTWLFPELRPHVQALSPYTLQKSYSLATLSHRMCRLALDLRKKPWELAWAFWAGNAKVPGRRRAKARNSKAQAQGKDCTTQVYM